MSEFELIITTPLTRSPEIEFEITFKYFLCFCEFFAFVKGFVGFFQSYVQRDAHYWLFYGSILIKIEGI